MKKILKKILGKKTRKLRYLFNLIIIKLRLEKIYIGRVFKNILQYKMELNKKELTFNEKIQYRKLNEKNSLFSLCADKYLVRDYVSEKIGSTYLIPLEFVGEKIGISDWEKLPNKFVIKTNHNSGSVYIINDKTKVKAEIIIKKIYKDLKEKYGIISLERYYDEIKPLILVEKFIGINGAAPDDFKFHCFKNNGDIKIFIQVDRGRFGNHCRNIYNEEWEFLNMKHNSKYSHIKEGVEKPKKIEKMKKIVKKMAEDFEYVRVDLYYVKEKIYFGELTFAHGGGFEDFQPNNIDAEWGSYWNLNRKDD